MSQSWLHLHCIQEALATISNAFIDSAPVTAASRKIASIVPSNKPPTIKRLSLSDAEI